MVAKTSSTRLGREAHRRLVEQQRPPGSASARAPSPASAARRPRACRRAGRAAPSDAGTARTCGRGRGRRRRAGARPVRRGKAPSSRLSVTRQRREHAPAFRRMRQAAPRDLVRLAAPRCPLPSSAMRPALGADHARHRAHRRRLAGAVGADQRHELALLDLQRDARAAPAPCRSRRRGSSISSMAIGPPTRPRRALPPR